MRTYCIPQQVNNEMNLSLCLALGHPFFHSFALGQLVGERARASLIATGFPRMERPGMEQMDLDSIDLTEKSLQAVRPFSHFFGPSHWFLVLSMHLAISRYSLYLLVSLGISRYLSVSPGISRYLSVSLGISRNLSVSPGISRYLSVSLGISRYLSVLVVAWAVDPCPEGPRSLAVPSPLQVWSSPVVCSKCFEMFQDPPLCLPVHWSTLYLLSTRFKFGKSKLARSVQSQCDWIASLRRCKPHRCMRYHPWCNRSGMDWVFEPLLPEAASTKIQKARPEKHRKAQEGGTEVQNSRI